MLGIIRHEAAGAFIQSRRYSHDRQSNNDPGSRSIRSAAEERGEYSPLAFAPCRARKGAEKAHADHCSARHCISSVATWRTASATPMPTNNKPGARTARRAKNRHSAPTWRDEGGRKAGATHHHSHHAEDRPRVEPIRNTAPNQTIRKMTPMIGVLDKRAPAPRNVQPIWSSTVGNKPVGSRPNNK